MKPAQLKRQKQLRAILIVMGGKYQGRNVDNYRKLAKITSSKPLTVQSWIGGYRNIPQAKLDLIQQSI